MKVILLYFTAILSVVLLMSEISLVWLLLLLLDIMLISWCCNNISLSELVRYSGYSTWYKFLKSQIMDYNEIILVIIAIIVFAIIGLAYLVHQAPAIRWILSILFWIGVIRHLNREKQVVLLGYLFLFSVSQDSCFNSLLIFSTE